MLRNLRCDYLKLKLKKPIFSACNKIRSKVIPIPVTSFREVLRHNLKQLPNTKVSWCALALLRSWQSSFPKEYRSLTIYKDTTVTGWVGVSGGTIG
jgi:predicted alpha-1,6-mannanase (GH76 family)